MKIKKTIMGAALVAACLVAFPACSGGGGGGGGENGGGTEGKPSTGTDIPTGLAPVSIAGKQLYAVNVNNTPWNWTYYFSSSTRYESIFVENAAAGYVGSYTYNRLSGNEASIEMSGVSRISYGGTGKETVTLHLKFISAKSAQGTMIRTYKEGNSSSSQTQSVTMSFTFKN